MDRDDHLQGRAAQVVQELRDLGERGSSEDARRLSEIQFTALDKLLSLDSESAWSRVLSHVAEMTAERRKLTALEAKLAQASLEVATTHRVAELQTENAERDGVAVEDCAAIVAETMARLNAKRRKIDEEARAQAEGASD